MYNCVILQLSLVLYLPNNSKAVIPCIVFKILSPKNSRLTREGYFCLILLGQLFNNITYNNSLLTLGKSSSMCSKDNIF